MAEKTYAIGRDGRVSLWVHKASGRQPEGAFGFEVINGGWRGRLDADGRIYIHHTGRYVEGPNAILWEGVVAPPHSRSYNDAIPWIEQQIADQINCN